MKKFMTILLAGVICSSALALASCGGDDKTNDTNTTGSTTPTTQGVVKDTQSTTGDDDKEPEDTRTPQEIFDAIKDNVPLEDDRIFLDFGARVTLTQENFNKLILEERMGVDTDTYELVLDQNAIEALKADENYGGLGFGQKMIAEIEGYIQNKKTGEKSESKMMIFTLHKSEEANEKLNPEG